MKMLFFLVALVTVPVMAAASNYDCIVTKGKGPFADRISFSFSEDTKSVVVDDGVIRHFEGHPLTGETGEFSEKKKVAKWRVTAINRSGQTTRLAFRAVILANGKLIMTAKPHGYSNVFNGRGRCRIVGS